jgi:hypothetical protein
MNYSSALIRIIFIIVSFLLCTSSFSHAQQLLRKTVVVNVKRQPVLVVLNELSRQGKFYFSYTSDVVRNDSLVTLSVQHKTVKQVLDMLFGTTRQYREIGDHIIIQHVTPDLSRTYTVSGYVRDRSNGTSIANATVYEKQQFISTLTNDQGFFRLRLKSTERYITAITISKDLYRDTTLTVHPGIDQEMPVITIRPAEPVNLAPVDVGVEKTWLGKFFLSSKQRMQSINLKGFFADKPFQYSIVPGLGTHGNLDAQVINKFSINLIGGYAAGLNGFEMGSVFNIDKKEAKGFQAAGVFNIVGGQVKGAQLAGVHNMVLDTLKGFQAAGAFNIVEGKVEGTQMAGVFNMARDSMKGFQAAGAFNMVHGPVRGTQLAGAFNYTDSIQHGFQAAGGGNISTGDVEGVQVAGGFNYARNLKGVQIGVVNIADTSSGYSIGLINIIKKGGYYRLALSANELTPWNLALKTGTPKFYGILLAGINTEHTRKLFTFGWGFGREWPLYQRLSLTTEFTSQNVYLGDWERLSLLMRVLPSLNYRLGKSLTVFAGPAVSIYELQEARPKAGYRQEKPGTIGWQAGISIF